MSLVREIKRSADEVSSSLLIVAGYDGVERILSDSVASLAKNLNATETHARHIRMTVERAVAPVQCSIWNLLDGFEDSVVLGTPGEDEESKDVSFGMQSVRENQPGVVSSGVLTLDACLNGGFARGMVSEVVGESSVGKTQLCLYVAVCTALGLHTTMHRPAAHSVISGGSGRTVALIATKGRSAAQHMVNRMAEMAREILGESYEKQGTYPADYIHNRVEDGVRLVLENVYLACAFTFDTAEHLLRYTLPGLITRKRHTSNPVELVVIDSIPPLLQEDFHETALPETSASFHSVRAFRLHELASLLKRLAVGTIAVIVTNHVNDAFAQDAALVQRALADDEIPWSKADLEIPYRKWQQTISFPLNYTLQAAHFSGLLAYVPRKENCDITMTTFLAERDSKVAQLGLVWTNCINARFLLTHDRNKSRNDHGIRRFRVVFSPLCTESNGEVYIRITRQGIQASFK